MKKTSIKQMSQIGMALALILLTFVQCQEKKMENPFFTEWNTPFQTPPFDQIKPEHYLPAYQEGIKQQKAEIEAIANNTEQPTFDNTIGALERSGKLLVKVDKVFTQIVQANTNDEIQKIAEQTTALMTKHNDDTNLNEKLFVRIKSIYDTKASLNLTPEQLTALQNYYLDFVLGGANLSPENKEKFRKVNDELSQLVLKFGDNVRRENSKFELVVEQEADLTGLPKSSVQEAKAKADAKGLTGKWIFTIDKPTLIPFLQYAENRGLREKMYRAYMNRGNNNDELDNKKIFSQIVNLRIDKANLLGYTRYSDVVLQRKMSKNAENVQKFLTDMFVPTVKTAKAEVEDMQKIINKEAAPFKLQPWDWWFYAEKVKKEKYNLSEEELRPYFEINNVVNGAFMVANKLWGLQFTELKGIQVYHPDMKVYEVKEADGKHVGLLYTDYFPRDSKANGAWCDGFRMQSNLDGKFVTPLIYNVGNFAKPTADTPALISVDDALTLFHEFGHGLAGLLQNITYPGAADVPSDFAELPSQIMENWAMQPEVLKMYAKHYKTGEAIPQELIDKINNARFFNQGFETLEYIAASILDMDWHVLTEKKDWDVLQFEKESIQKMGLIPEVWPRYLTTNFIHIATWGYESGYYSYLWAAVLDSDAFEAFMETSLFDQTNAASFRKNVLEKAGSEDLMESYKKFRGREPKIDALLKKRGLN